MMRTKSEIQYKVVHYGLVAVIPAGTSVTPADNLPQRDDGKNQFWVEPWDNMHESEQAWYDNYGFLVTEDDVTPSTFSGCLTCGGNCCDGEYNDSCEPEDGMDGDAQSALASAGFGTDEDYEHNDEWQGDSDDGTVGID
jgi:hypothetical protein